MSYNKHDGSAYAPVAQVVYDDTDSNGLNDNLVGPPRGTSVAASSAQPLMQVTAPATLPEGYQFTAHMGNRTVQVTVPPGGVEEGQKFSVPLPTDVEASLTGISVPVGHWRDGIFDCFKYGACHPHCWTAACCCLIAAAQVVARLKLTVLGRPGTIQASTGAFQKLLACCVLFWVVRMLLTFVIDYDVIRDNVNAYNKDATIMNVWRLSYWIFTAMILFNVRKTVRERYAIVGSNGQDAVCACCCPCLIGGQMLRHTTDYDVYPATCCTERGIPASAPSIV